MGYLKVREMARKLRRNQTPAELFFWEKVRKRQVLGRRFNRQFIIQHEDIMGKKAFFIVDFYCHEQKLIVELDGSIHQEEEQQRYDEQRTSILEEMGFKVIRFENKEVLEAWDDVEERLKQCLQ